VLPYAGVLLRYDDPTVLRLVSGPLLHDVVAAAAEAVRSHEASTSNSSSGANSSGTSSDGFRGGDGGGVGIRLRLLLGHDVTLLALWHALRAGGALRASASSELWGPHGWPPYASALVVELFELREPGEPRAPRELPSVARGDGDGAVMTGAVVTGAVGSGAAEVARRYALRVSATFAGEGKCHASDGSDGSDEGLVELFTVALDRPEDHQGVHHKSLDAANSHGPAAWIPAPFLR